MKATYTSSLLAMLSVVVLILSGCTGSESNNTEDEEWSTATKQAQRNNSSSSNSYSSDSDSKTRSKSKSQEGGELGEALSELEDALDGLGEAFGGGNKVEAVDFRELRTIMPDRIRGMEKGKSNGERTGALGFRISQVDQMFAEENGNGRLDISIVDLGGLKNVASMGLNWLQMDVDRESDDGYERTRTYREHPVLDKCSNMSGKTRCEMTVFVSERFVVSLESRDMDAGMLEDILEDMDIRKLERMKEEGISEDG
ncbi:MAG: hypothetical protein AAF564_01355 [Bacteroidota bacterium]